MSLKLPESTLRTTKQDASTISEYLSKATVNLAGICDREPRASLRADMNEAIADLNHCINIADRLHAWSLGYLDMEDVPVSAAEINQAYDLGSDMDDALHRAVKVIRESYETWVELRRYASKTDHLFVSKHYINAILTTYQRYSNDLLRASE